MHDVAVLSHKSFAQAWRSSSVGRKPSQAESFSVAPGCCDPEVSVAQLVASSMTTFVIAGWTPFSQLRVLLHVVRKPSCTKWDRGRSPLFSLHLSLPRALFSQYISCRMWTMLAAINPSRQLLLVFYNVDVPSSCPRKGCKIWPLHARSLVSRS